MINPSFLHSPPPKSMLFLFFPAKISKARMHSITTTTLSLSLGLCLSMRVSLCVCHRHHDFLLHQWPSFNHRHLLCPLTGTIPQTPPRTPPWKMKRLLPTQYSKLRHRINLHLNLNPDRRHHFNLLWRHQILDPGSDIVAHWNQAFLVTSIIALFIDPLYFFLHSVPPDQVGCLQTNETLRFGLTIARSIADLFYFLHMIMKFRTAFVSPSSRVFGRGELVMDAWEIAWRYLKSDFIIDLAATLPLPQIVMWLVIPKSKNKEDQGNNTIALIVLVQYVPRLFLIFPLNQRIIKTTGVVAKTVWAGAAYNLLLYMLASHVLGASWYLLSIGRQYSCWREHCDLENNETKIPNYCQNIYFNCDNVHHADRMFWLNVTQVIENCDRDNFKFGMFEDAFKNQVVSANLTGKYFYSLWWGLRNLSSYGQTLDTSTNIVENVFCIVICIGGLVLFSQLIGNMQTYLQSMTVRFEEWRVKRRDTEEWMRHRQLPENLQERVRRYVQYNWLTTKGVNEENILYSLPLDLRREIQRHLCLSLVLRVPFFSQMDRQLVDAICERLVSSLSTQDTLIVTEGDPVNEMFFIIRGQLESSTTNGGRDGFFNSITLRPGDFCGEELLTWALMPDSSANLPSSTRTVRALCEVEAFALRAEDLKLVANQFKRLHSKKLQHAFRYYSHQWRTWGACRMQAAWRRHRKRILAKELARQEYFYYMPIPDRGSNYSNELADGNTEDVSGQSPLMGNKNNVQQLGATILASRFASNTRKGVNQKVQFVEPASTSLTMPKLFKPDEPDFFIDREDV